MENLKLKKAKRFLALVIATVITSSCASEAITASAINMPETSSTSSWQVHESGASITSGDYTYNVLEDGTAEITKYTGYEKNLIIPDKLDGKTVTSIGNSAFKVDTIRQTSFLRSVTIPSSVTNIGRYAFENCSTLESITIPDSVTSIGGYAFKKCSSLKEIEIPNSVTEISERTFINCSNLTNVIIPNSVTKIGEGAFIECTSLVTLNIPDSVNEIEGSIFNGCSSLETIVVPDTVTSFNSSSAFYRCSSLTSVKLPVKLTTIGSNAFRECSSLKSMKIPDSITYIRDDAFMKCTSLEEVTIPDTVSEIENSVFSGCTSLKEITIPQNVVSLGTYVFSGCASLEKVTVKGAITTFGSNAFNNCDNVTVYCYHNSSTEKYVTEKGISYVLLDDESKDVPNYADFKYKALDDGTFEISKYTGSDESTKIPTEVNGKAVTSIGSNAFLNCTTLKDIEIPSSVITINYNAFYGCSSLEKVNIKGSVTTIGGSAFEDCSSLKSINIPDSVTAIGYYAFDGTSWLENYPDDFVIVGKNILLRYKGTQETVTIPNYVTQINYYAFTDNSTIKKVIIPNSVSAINGYAFNNCSLLVNVTLPNSLLTISENLFFKCSSLKNITIPNTVTSIEKCAFDMCSSLESINIPNSVTTIGADAFGKCKSLKKVTIPNSITSISLNTFEGCSSLTDVEIPNSVTYIGDAAFNSCTLLKKIIIPASVTEIGYGSFDYCTELKKIYFAGDMPSSIGYSSSVIGNYRSAFNKVVATVYYPEGNSTWSDVSDGTWYNGTMTFVPYSGKLPIEPETPKPVVSEFTIDSTAAGTVNEEIRINGKISLDSASDDAEEILTKAVNDVKWTVDNSENAEIVNFSPIYSADYTTATYTLIVKPLKTGTFTITGETSGLTASCKITSNSVERLAARLEVSDNTEVKVDKYQTINITAYDKDGNKLTEDDVWLTYEFDNPDVVSVVEQNFAYIRVKGVKKGSTNITLTDEKSGIKKKIMLSVISNKVANRIEVNKTNKVELGKTIRIDIHAFDSSNNELDYNDLDLECSFKPTKYDSRIDSFIDAVTIVESDNSHISVTGKYEGVSNLIIKDKNSGIETNIQIEVIYIGNKFSPGRDGWCIGNNEWFYGYENGYTIPLERYFDVYGISASSLITGKLKGTQTWEGNCFGLALLSLSQYYGIVDLSNFFPETEKQSTNRLYEFGYNSIRSSTDEDIGDYFSVEGNDEAIYIIEGALLSQDSKEFKATEISNLKDDSKYSKLIDYLNNDNSKPIIANLVGFAPGENKIFPTYRHTVVIPNCYKPIKVNDDEYVIIVYDCNSPVNSVKLNDSGRHYQNRTLTYLKINTNNEKWEYYSLGKEQYYGFYDYDGSDKNKLKFYDVSSLDKDYFERPLTLWHNHIKIYINRFESFTLNNTDGNTLFKVDNGEITYISDDCDYSPQFAENGEGTNTIYDLHLNESEFICSGSISELLAIGEKNIIAISTDNKTETTINTENGTVKVQALDEGEIFVAIQNNVSDTNSLKAIQSDVSLQKGQHIVVALAGNNSNINSSNKITSNIKLDNGGKIAEFDNVDVSNVSKISINDLSIEYKQETDTDTKKTDTDNSSDTDTKKSDTDTDSDTDTKKTDTDNSSDTDTKKPDTDSNSDTVSANTGSNTNSNTGKQSNSNNSNSVTSSTFSSNSGTSTSPKTGDSRTMVLEILIMTISALTFLIMFSNKRKYDK